MALQIQGRPTDFCLKNCPNMELDISTETMYADGDPYFTRSEVSCRYEKICKMWHDQQETAKPGADWKIWGGWQGNHDARIEDATCSKCGYKNPTVYGSTDKLPKVCPGCHSEMGIKEV